MPQNIYFEKIGQRGKALFWGHGWGQNHQSFRALAESLKNHAQHWLIDFPGFGQSPLPDDVWGSAEYADETAKLIKSQTDEKIIWVGHSFGCRVGLQLALRHPDLISGLVLIAGAGLPRKRPLWHTLYYGARVYVFKALKKLTPEGPARDKLYAMFGSADYKNAGALRQILVKTVNEDLSDIAQSISCPVLLLYGSQDTETPPEIGQRLEKLIPNAKLIVMDGFDHYTILTNAQHQIVKQIDTFIKDHT